MLSSKNPNARTEIMSDESQVIAIEQVKLGMFIKLDLSWFEHSFPMNSFKITNQNQLDQLYALRLKHLRYIPSKSDILATPIDVLNAPIVIHTAIAQDGEVFDNLIAAKRARFEKLTRQRAELLACEEKFVHAATVVKSINKTIFSQPESTILEARKLIDSIADVFLQSNETVMHLIQQTGANEELYFHTLNVAVLAMMLANELKCTEGQIKSVGLAALFHDLGKVNIPEKILMKTDALTKAEQNFFELHPQYGVEVGKTAGLPPVALEIIAQHHEYLDGSGYPNRIKADQIRLPTRIVSIANVYDNLCNHIDPRMSLTPHEALSTMYAHRRAQFDPSIMATMVKSLGVFPPGTLVRLSNEALGLVMNVNVGKPLRPRILVYDPDIPKDDAIILDLADEASDLSITGSIRPGVLPKAIFDYLSPRKRVNYYFDSQSKKSSSPPSPTP